MASAMRGQDAFVRRMQSASLWPIAEVLLVLVPLAFHALYGVYLLASKTARADVSPYPPPWALVSRIGAAVALVFIGFHYYELRGAQLFGQTSAASFETVLIAHLSSLRGEVGFLPAMPWNALFYLVGIGGTVTHFGCASWGFLVRRGYATTALSMRRAAVFWGALSAVLFAISAAAVVSLATGAPVFSLPRVDPMPSVCPAPLP